MTDISSRGSGRDALVAAIEGFLAGSEPLEREGIHAALEREIDAAGPRALADLKARLLVESGWEYAARDPLARRLHHLLAEQFLDRESQVTGREHLAAVSNRPVAIFSNHLSYADANVIDVLLVRAGGAALADRLTALAGPKVFTSRERRFSSLCFGTVRVPQSTEVSSGEAVLNAREVARAARHAIDVAHARLAAGDALLLFGEGTRSRTARMQVMLAGVARYLDVPGTLVLPVGLTGSEALFPVGDTRLRPTRVALRIGAPIEADALSAAAGGDRRIIMDAVGLAIAAVLPPEYRGVYEDASQYGNAPEVLRQCRAEAF